MTDTLDLTPSQDGYSVRFGSGVIATEVGGGPARYMVDQARPSHRVRLQWSTNRAGYDYLVGFYETNVGQAFNIKLPLNDGGLETYKAFFEPEGLRLTGTLGSTYVVEAQLEVEYNDATAFQKALDSLLEIYPTNLKAVLIGLHELVVRLSRICR